MAGRLPRLQPYGNRHGDSGVTAWAIVGGILSVEFAGDPVYVYSARDVGADTYVRLCAAARAGRGLSTMISREVGDDYLVRFDNRAQWREALAGLIDRRDQPGP